MKKLLFWLVVFLVLFFATKTIAEDQVAYSDPLSPDNVIYKPYVESPPPVAKKANQNQNNGIHSIRASTTISAEALRLYLESKHSPLAPYSVQILQSPYWSTIIGICTIEQYGCGRAPNTSPYNFWGIMKPGGGLAAYSSYEQGIAAISTFLANADAKGKTTVERLNGWYVVPASASWFNTVIKTKNLVEAL